MTRFSLFAVILLVHVLWAKGHELPDKEIERRVQVSVKLDRVLVQYSLAMNEATLKTQLRQHGCETDGALPVLWKRYEEIVLPLLSTHMHLLVNGKDTPLQPIRADYSGWSHRHLTCLLRAEIQLSGSPTKILIKDENFWDAPGNYRIAMKGVSGAKMQHCSAPPIVSRVKPVDFVDLPQTEKESAATVEGTFIVASRIKSRADTLFPDELVKFVASPHNPVFRGTGADTWDRKIRERGCVMFHDGKWHLWYTGYNGDRAAKKMLGYATSVDGLVWDRHPGNPVYSKTWTEDVHVIHHQNQFVMVAEGRNDIPHMMTSQNGVDWMDCGRIDVRDRDGKPISPGPYGTPTLWNEGKKSYLFYERGDRGVWLAESMDLKTWKNVDDVPVLSRGPDTYDQHAIALNQIIRHGGRYYGIYHANADQDWKGPWTTCIAVSDDLKTWKKYSGNPIVRTNHSSGQLVHDGQQYRLYTAHPDVRVYFNETDNSSQ